MKNLKLLLSQTLTWTFSKKKITLKSNDTTIIELLEEKSNRATFVLDGKNYRIHNEGFWNAKTIIQKDGHQTLIMKRNFLGNKCRIELENGNSYSCKITNSPLATLRFMNNYEQEILHYKLDATHKPKTVLKIVDHSINEIDLLLLIILGCYCFKGIVIENDTADLMLLISG